MKRLRFLITGILFLLYFFIISSVQAQDNKTIILRDTAVESPITGATFQYGDQSGISDEEGQITYQVLDQENMHLSHISYGTWILTADALASAESPMVFHRSSSAVSLFPVTIISVRPKTEESKVLDLDFQEKMAHDAGALLTQTPAIGTIRKGGNYGFDPVLRGFKYDQLNIVMNGSQSATAACPNRMDPPTSQMAPNMIDRIEILKGPYALRYGAGFGGTINFVANDPRFASSTTSFGRLSGGYETNGQLLRSEAMVGLRGEKYETNLYGSWSQGNDYTTGQASTVQADFKRVSFGGQVNFKLASNQTLQLSANKNVARDADFPALGMDLRDDDTWMFQASHKVTPVHSNLQSWTTTLFGSFVDHLMDNGLKPLNPRMMNAATNAKTNNYGGRMEGIWNTGSGKWFTGADVRIENARGIRTREFLMGPNAGKVLYDNAWQNSQISKAGLFTEYKFPIDRYRFVFSGRVDLNHAMLSNADQEFTQHYDQTTNTQLNPNIALGGLRYFDHGMTVGLWLGHARRSGSLTERFINYFPVGQDPYEMLGNPMLRPEKNNQVDLTYEWKTVQSALNVDVFAAYMTDYISSVIQKDLNPRLPMSPGVRKYMNIDQALKTGIEIRWKQNLTRSLSHQIAFAYTYGQNLKLDEPLPEIAPFDVRYRLAGSFFQQKFRPEVQFRYVSAQDRISSEFGETITPSFSLLDLHMGYTVTQNIGINVSVNNLLNKGYYEHLNRSVRGSKNPIYAPGRSFLFSFNVRF
ncbi:TonB-dependent receptor [Membranicola marinus]|uniref:TonB-dependent receptor n=1 Tax=Membranihabitans marinus TaxID=1227546 RepID=A0A953HTQ3_9BACT|nr:TonB-dependent receptor [Membranihabitans marinus]MBY5958250.1 TonB-dependent receptor [Membranihabitans marinus]